MDAKKSKPNKQTGILVPILSGLLSLLTRKAHMKDLHWLRSIKYL